MCSKNIGIKVAFFGGTVLIARAIWKDPFALTWAKIRRARPPCLSPAPARFSYFFLLNDFQFPPNFPPPSRSLEQATFAPVPPIVTSSIDWWFDYWYCMHYSSAAALLPDLALFSFCFENNIPAGTVRGNVWEPLKLGLSGLICFMRFMNRDVSCGIHTIMSGSYEVIIEPIKLKQVW